MSNTTTTENGQGNLCALDNSEKFNQELVAQAFLRDGCMINFLPCSNDYRGTWDVNANDESGNCEASASFSTYKEALRFIDGLCLLAEMKEKAEALSRE